MNEFQPDLKGRFDFTAARRKLTFSVLELRWLGRVFVSSADRFYWDNGFSKAASLAYSTLLSLVPLTALCFGILAAFLLNGDASSARQLSSIREFIYRLFVPSNEFLEGVLPHIEKWSANIVQLNYLALGALIATSLLLLNSIEYTLNQVWQVYEARRITDRLMIFCAIIVLIPVFAVSGYYTSTKVEPLFSDFGLLSGVYHDTLPFLVDSIAFVALYYLVPKAPVRFIAAIFGGVTASLLFGLAKHWFAFYIGQFATYNGVYEQVALIPIFLIWLYVSWSIVLFGAEISYQAQHLPRTGQLWKRSFMSVGDGAMLLAVQTLVLVARSFKSGTRIPNELEIAEALGCSSVVLKTTLDALQQAGIIMRGDGRDMPILLMRSPESVSMADIREAVFKKREAMFLGEEISRMYGAFRQGQRAKDVSLEDLIQQRG